jgi:hypothetical protein
MQAYSYLVIFTLFVISGGVLFFLKSACDKKNAKGLVLLMAISILMTFSIMSVGKAEGTSQTTTSGTTSGSSGSDKTAQGKKK